MIRMNGNKVTESIIYVGVDDKEMDLFESQYVTPNGVSYNSYIILDDKIAIMDTVDDRKTDEWIANIEKVLDGKEPDYLVVSHMEPDHSANIANLTIKYPNMRVVGNVQIFKMISQFFDIDLGEKAICMKEGDILDLGKHKLHFIMAPMVHWPEVMMSYEETEKVLFSADGFGKFGTLDTEEDWTCEARRYYFNIVGKYGANVQAVLKKAANLDIQIICPLHGPILDENLEYYINKYDIWSSYRPEDDGVLVAYASIHGHTAKAAEKMAEILKEKGSKKVVIADLSRDDMAEAIEDAFRYDKIVVAAATYNTGIFPWMEHFLMHLQGKNYQNRKVGIIENGTWAPMSGKLIKEIFNKMKDITICEQMVTIKSAMKEENIIQMEKLADELLK
jgi:flavorubredoxin